MELEGKIGQLWRYPVKSLLGESCTELSINRRGVIGDRWYAICDRNGKFGSGKNTRRFRQIDGLFKFQASYDDGVPIITFPDRRTMRGDDPKIDAELSSVLGQPVTLVEEKNIPHFDADSLHLITSASLEWLKSLLPNSVIDERRFRPNLLINLPDRVPSEHRWIGKRLSIGQEVEVEVTELTERCVMTCLEQQELAYDSEIIKTIKKKSNLNFGVYAKVIKTGVVRMGDRICCWLSI
ncbi:MAG: MOSC domain-containing protein [Waterburya sp.]